MKAPRLQLARTVATLRSAARRRGRELVEVVRSPELSGRVARTALAVGSAPVRQVGLLRARSGAWSLRSATAQGFDALLHLLPDGPLPALVLEELRVSRDLDVNLRLRGAPGQLTEVTGLGLAGPTGVLEVTTLRAQHGDALWLTGVLPEEAFAGPTARSRLLVHAGTETVRVRGGRNRLQHRWSRRSYERDGWPVRVRLDWRRRLIVTGTRPAFPDVAYAVHSEPDALILSWQDPTTSASVARLTHRRTGEVVVGEGWNDPDVGHQVRLDFERLVDPADDWDIEVLTAEHGPVRLASRPGTYPSLRAIVRFPDAYAVSPRLGALWGTLRFSAGNTLVARVRPAAAEQ